VFQLCLKVFPQKAMVAEDEWLPMFNKVNGTENIYAIGDTCIQLTDGGFPNGSTSCASCDSKGWIWQKISS
jgi:hypothetical protein